MRDVSKKGLRILLIHRFFLKCEVLIMQTGIKSLRWELPQMKMRAKRPSVLLVEDYEDNRLMMKQLLEMSGYRVFEATNGEQAIKLARLEIPDLILMDLSLPQVDGLSATRQIRAVPYLRDVPIVAVSAHDTADFHAEALASGCNEYVTKPIDFGQLEDVIRNLLSRD